MCRRLSGQRRPAAIVIYGTCSELLILGENRGE
jgi:hypothetical protein